LTADFTPHDIAGGIAHAKMLGKQGISLEKKPARLLLGLSPSWKKSRGKFEFKIELEDIHMAVESRLIEKIGRWGASSIQRVPATTR
jgi:argininosuccinate lyase